VNVTSHCNHWGLRGIVILCRAAAMVGNVAVTKLLWDFLFTSKAFRYTARVNEAARSLTRHPHVYPSLEPYM